jgi:predicted nucleic acid-binding protein
MAARRKVFLDSGGLLGLIHRRDQHHQRALGVFSRLIAARTPLLITDYVTDEALTLLKVRCGQTGALGLLDFLDSCPVLEWEWISPDLFRAASRFFRVRGDHEYSFTDCTSFLTMRAHGLSDAFTTDRHFVEAGFRALLVAD